MMIKNMMRFDTVLYFSLQFYVRLKGILQFHTFYCTTLYNTMLYYIISYYTIRYRIILYYTILYYIIPYFTMIYYTTLHYTTLYRTMLHLSYPTQVRVSVPLLRALLLSLSSLFSDPTISLSHCLSLSLSLSLSISLSIFSIFRLVP